MPETLASLRAMGVELNPTDGHKFSGICLPRKARGSLRFSARARNWHAAPAVACTDGRQAEECGVDLLWKTPATGMDSRGVQLSRGKIRARWIVGADGLGSRVRRWSGLETAKRSSQRFATRRHYRLQPWSNYVEIYWGVTLKRT